MKTIKIRIPIWDGYKIGIAEYKIQEITYIEVTYTDKYGQRVFPNIYSISKSKALTYPTYYVKGVKLRIIPIADLEIYK